MVSDTQKLKGYGGLIVDDLISQTSSSIYLSVDNNNEIAKNLYKKKNFVTVDKNDKYKIMCREKI
jgi:ribosomal protein S18 acetylase RimI-like enzyme